MANPLPIKITELDLLNLVANDDIFITVDKSDTAHSSNGTTKKVTAQTFKNYTFSDFTFGSIDNHTDISITNLAEDQLLKYDNTEQKWVNWSPNYITAQDVNLDNVVRDTDFTTAGLIKRGATEGTYSVITDNSTNWDTAHGWGDHASAGYLTSAGLGNVSINALSDVDTTSNAPTNGQVLIWAQPDPGIDGKWVPSSVTGGGDVTLSSFSVQDPPPTASGNGSLQYTQSTGVFTYTPPDLSDFITSTNLSTEVTTALGNSSINSFNDVNTQTNAPGTNDVLTWNGSNWVPAAATGGTGLQNRATTSGETASVSDGTSVELNINNVAKTYALLKIQTSAAAWVTLYTSDAARDADASRTETTDPLPGSGVIAEVITTGAATQSITPGTLGWNNDDPNPTSTVYAKVVNKSGGEASITVTLTYVALEG